jgi:hypothetical protein
LEAAHASAATVNPKRDPKNIPRKNASQGFIPLTIVQAPFPRSHPGRVIGFGA